MNADFMALADGIIASVKSYFAGAIKPVNDRLNSFDARILTIQDSIASDSISQAKSVMELEIARWALDFEKRAHETLQRTIDRFPAARDGKDGLGFDDLKIEHDGERNFSFIFSNGEKIKEFKFKIDVVLDRGYFNEGLTFEKGDGVTFGGSYWIAQMANNSKPEIGNNDWRLAVKKGRDSKQAATKVGEK